MASDALAVATERLIEAVSRDVNGIPGMPFSGNGGLVSQDTIRAADQARLALYRYRRALNEGRER